jgi:hypothetical protein
MKRRPLSLFDKTGETILRDLQSWQRLVEASRDLRLGKNEFVQLAVIGSKESLPELLQSRRAPSGISHLVSGQDVELFEYKRTYGREGAHRVSGRFAVARTQSDHIYLVLFVNRYRFWQFGLSPLVDSMYPRVVRPFLTQSELHQLLKDLQKAISPEALRVLEFSSKQRLPALARKRFQSVREWTDVDLDVVFREAKERNVWFSSVAFDIISERDGQVEPAGVRCRVSKHAYFACNGRFEVFERTLVRQLIQISSERLKFFSNRERFSTRDHAPRPLSIGYEHDIFKSSDQTRKLVEAMQRLKHGTCTVLHSNPYVHLSVVDNIDFSSADVWVLSQNQILILPQLRASEAALKRIVNHIFEQFREGRISDFQA